MIKQDLSKLMKGKLLYCCSCGKDNTRCYYSKYHVGFICEVCKPKLLKNCNTNTNCYTITTWLKEKNIIEFGVAQNGNLLHFNVVAVLNQGLTSVNIDITGAYFQAVFVEHSTYFEILFRRYSNIAGKRLDCNQKRNRIFRLFKENDILKDWIEESVKDKIC